MEARLENTAWSQVFASKDFIPFPKSVLQSTTLDSKQKHLLMYLLAYCGSHDNCRCSQTKLGSVVFSKEPNPVGKVRCTARELEKAGYLKIDKASVSFAKATGNVTVECFDYFPFPAMQGEGSLCTRLIRGEDCIPIPRKLALSNTRTDAILIYCELLDRCRYTEGCKFVPREIAELFYPGDYRSFKGICKSVERVIKTLVKDEWVRKEIRVDPGNNNRYTWLFPMLSNPLSNPVSKGDPLLSNPCRTPKSGKNQFFNYSMTMSEFQFSEWSESFSSWVKENAGKNRTYQIHTEKPLADWPKDHYLRLSKKEEEIQNTVSALPPLHIGNLSSTARGERELGVIGGSDIGSGDHPSLVDIVFTAMEEKGIGGSGINLGDLSSLVDNDIKEIKDNKNTKDIIKENIKDIIKENIKDIIKENIKDIIKEMTNTNDITIGVEKRNTARARNIDNDITVGENMPRKIDIDWEEPKLKAEVSKPTKPKVAPIEIRKASEGPDPAAREKALARRVDTLSRKTSKRPGTGTEALSASPVSPSQAAKLLQAEFDLLTEQAGYPAYRSETRTVKQWKEWYQQQDGLEEALGYLRWFFEEWGCFSNGPLAFTKARYPTPIMIMSSSHRQTLHSQGYIYEKKEKKEEKQKQKSIGVVIDTSKFDAGCIDLDKKRQEQKMEETMNYVMQLELEVRNAVIRKTIGKKLSSFTVEQIKELEKEVNNERGRRREASN